MRVIVSKIRILIVYVMIEASILAIVEVIAIMTVRIAEVLATVRVPNGNSNSGYLVSIIKDTLAAI